MLPILMSTMRSCGSYIEVFSMSLRKIVQKKKTTFTKRTRNGGLTRARLIVEAGIQSFPDSKKHELVSNGTLRQLNE